MRVESARAGMPPVDRFDPSRQAARAPQRRNSPLEYARGELRAAIRSLVFFVRVSPMLPSRPVDWLTGRPLVQKVSYGTHTGRAESDLYRPPSDGPHPGVLCSLGVVPLGVEHPQVRRLGQALARFGFVALLHWSGAMRDLRLTPGDVGDFAAAYEALLAQPGVDPDRSGILGACVGGAFGLMAAAGPRIRGRLAYVSAYAPYFSMRTLVRDIASATRTLDDQGGTEPWPVDPITWKTYVRTLTDGLLPGEAQCLRSAFEDHIRWNATQTAIIRSPQAAHVDLDELSDDGRASLRLLRAADAAGAEEALHLLPPAVQARLTAMSPAAYLRNIEAPLIHLMHDRYDPVIPVGESRRRVTALSGRPGVRYTELGFRHLDPTRLSLLRLARELPRFYFALYPVFRAAVAARTWL